MLGPEITIYRPDQRDAFGQYSILPGHTHVFAFTLPLLDGLKISAAHIFQNSQDFSILMWLTTSPLDNIILEQGFGRLKAPRRPVEFLVYDDFLKTGDDDERLFLRSGETYFLNVKNLQNRQNAYELTFDSITQTQ